VPGKTALSPQNLLSPNTVEPSFLDARSQSNAAVMSPSKKTPQTEKAMYEMKSQEDHTEK